MLDQKPKSFSEYNKLKEEAFLEIKKEEALRIFPSLKDKLLIELESLNINHISEIEDFYLHVAKLIYCLSFIHADKVSKKEKIDFDDALNTVSTDDIIKSLIETFNKEINQSYLYKIKKIDDKQAPAKQSWAGLHARFLVLYQVLKEEENFKLASLVQKSIASLKHEEHSYRKDGKIKLAEAVKQLRDTIRISAINYFINKDKSLFADTIHKSFSYFNEIKEENKLKRIIDYIARVIIGFLFKTPNSDFSFFTNPIKDNIKKLEMGLNSKCGQENKCN